MPTIKKIRPYWLPEKPKPFENVERPESENYSTRRWKKIRYEVLRKEPLCRICQSKGITTPAVTVDHILSITDGGSFWSYANLQPLCAKCHKIKTYQDMKKRRLNKQ
jgi:5-methylcytosine-specific restriction endonuclease McrA